MSHECNNFIIQEGKFLRDFEGMYANVTDPWDQEAKADTDLLNTTALFFLGRHLERENKCIRSILDIGCANGYHASALIDLTQGGAGEYVGTDISPTVIQKAKSVRTRSGETREFFVDDIRIHRAEFENCFDLVFSGKTIYYVSPEIDIVLPNIISYLNEEGLFCYTYNYRKDAFTGKWLTYLSLREKILQRGLQEILMVELNRLSEEVEVVAIFKKQRGAG